MNGDGPASGLTALLRSLETGRAGWAATLAGAALIALPNADWRIPDENGLPYPPLFTVAALVSLAALAGWTRTRKGRWPGPFEALAVLVGVGAALGALTVVASQPLRDLGVYLHAGDAWRRGEPVYLDHLLTAAPDDKTRYPFLYPPPVLVAFGLAGTLPGPFVVGSFVVVSVALVVAALRLFGLPWRWTLAALLWRPVLEGLWVGNVAVPLVALLAVAPRLPAALALPPAFKAYSATTVLWLVRERRWRSLAVGVAIVAALALVTLPLAGLDRWREWLHGLDLFARSQPLVPDYLYGVALQRWLPPAAALAIGIVVLALALVPRGVEGLARLGLATPVLSPSVFVHGLLVAVPAFLTLRPAFLWLALAAMSFGQSAWWWVGPAIAVASWGLPGLRRATPADGERDATLPDPLGGASGPWVAWL